MRLGFFGGSFDPPHRGHLAIAAAAQAAFQLDEILFAPTGNQPLKPTGPQASFNDRLAMVTLLCEGHSGFKPSLLDAPLPDGSPNYTIDTIARLRTSLGSGSNLFMGEIFMIVGADSFRDLPHWQSPEALLSSADWIIVTRPGVPLGSVDLTPQQQQRIHLLEGIHEPASSTEVRTRLSQGQTCDELVPRNILEYIHRHHLYEIE